MTIKDWSYREREDAFRGDSALEKETHDKRSKEVGYKFGLPGS